MERADSWTFTERLRLRPWRPQEAERLFDIRRREEVARWLGDPTPWTDVSTAQEKIASWHDTTLASGPLGVWAVTSISGPINELTPHGTVSLGQLPGSDEIEIGWYLHPDSGGQGFAGEAARALLNRALLVGVPQIWAIMWPQNAPSARVATAIGMTDLGVIDDPWYGTEADPQSRVFRAERALKN